MILPLVLNRCEIFSHMLRDEYGLRVLRRIFESKRDEVAGGCRKFQIEELYNLFCGSNICRAMR